MVIEFCGLPGVGKSTIARALEKHGFVRVRIQSKIELFWYNSLYFFIYPVAFFKIFFCIIKTSIIYGRLYRLIMNVFLDTNARIMKAKHLKIPAIIDQGHLQALLSLSYHELTEREVQNFLRYLPRPDQVILFTASPSTREAHLDERGYRPREDELEANDWLLYIEHNIETIFSSIQKNNTYVTHCISTERSKEEIIEEILLYV